MVEVTRAGSWLWLVAILSQSLLVRLAVEGSSTSGNKASTFLSKSIQGGATRPQKSDEPSLQRDGSGSQKETPSLSHFGVNRPSSDNHTDADEETIYVRKRDGSMELLQENKVGMPKISN